jgi:plasmid maintenance system antidote protein VapI
LALLLKKNHLSFRKAAMAWGLDKAHVHHLMTGKFVVTAATVATICKKLGEPDDRVSLTEAFLTDELEKLRRDLGIVWKKDQRKGGAFEIKPGA